MILAYLEGIPKFLKSPVTWCLIALNVIVHMLSFPYDMEATKHRKRVIENDFFVETQGRLYAQYIITHPGKYTGYIVDVASLASLGKSEKEELLGHLAFQDTEFVEDAMTFQFSGDQVAVEYWRDEMKAFQTSQLKNPKMILGLISSEKGNYRWISYSFAHDGMAHLLFNMWFLMIFGGFLERRMGSIGFLLLYLTTAVAAAWSFEFVSGLSGMPLVGASGAISGLMGAFVLICWRRSLRIKLDSPVEGQEPRYVYVPAWFDVAVWMLLQIGGYMQTLREFGGVAYITHLGGMFFGFLIAAIVFRNKMEKATDVVDDKFSVAS